MYGQRNVSKNKTPRQLLNLLKGMCIPDKGKWMLGDVGGTVNIIKRADGARTERGEKIGTIHMVIPLFNLWKNDGYLEKVLFIVNGAVEAGLTPIYCKRGMKGTGDSPNHSVYLIEESATSKYIDNYYDIVPEKTGKKQK